MGTGFLKRQEKRSEEEKDRMGGLYKSAFSIAWPAAVEGTLISIISSVDTMMVKIVDPYAIASVSLASQPRLILLILAQALCVGTTALVARRKGEGNREGAASVLSQSMVIITVIGLLISALGYFLAGPLMDLAGADADTKDMSAEYFRIVSFGLVFNSWSLCLCAALRATGNTKITMVTNITANVVNVILNYCLIGGRFGFPALGVKGAAIATVIGTMTGTAIAFRFAMDKKGYLRYRIGLPKFDRRTLSGLFKVGMSSVAESVALRLGMFINTRMVAGVGADALTGHTVVQQVTSLSFTVGDGIATAGATLVGQSLGANKKKQAADYITVVRRMGIIVSVALMIMIFFLRDTFSYLFTDIPVVIEGAGWAFIVVIVGMIPQNARVICSGCLRGAGDVKFVAIASLISVTILRPIITYICCYPLNEAFPYLFFSYTGPWIAFVIDAVVRQILLGARIRHGRYLDIRL
ncbi:MAG: MATE family efflux transporter [Lachnospiraceae bacterium]|nr:MATE family efflux transporter [Butyrivibrio sp.]MBQ9910931.1 MATE family efflux transporter [Lachnospiraceae bacterium]